MTESVLTTQLRITGGSRTFVRGDEQVHALRGVELELRGGEFVALRATGHCPNLSAPEETASVIAGYLRSDVHARS